MTLDTHTHVPPEAYFEEQAAMQLLVPRAKVLAALADAYGAEPAAPVLFVSPLQLAAHRDHEGAENAEAGRYLPARKTPAGKFTQPLYALPPAAPGASHPTEDHPVAATKIALAIDALASAAFVEGGISPENTQAARDLTEQRKHELIEAIGARCLAQIEEPTHLGVNAREAFGSRYNSDPADPACANDLAVYSAGWNDARAGAAPAAVAPQGEYPPLPEAAYPCGPRAYVLAEDAWTADQLRAYFDLGRQPAAVAGPAWDKTRDSLSMLMMGFASNPSRSIQAACTVLDSATEPGMPLAYLRGAAPASDTALLDAMTQHRIALVPENEGPWDAEVYGETEATPAARGTGATPREALSAALATMPAAMAALGAAIQGGGAA